MTHTIDKNERFLRARHASGILGIAVSTLWLWSKEKEGFPQPRKITPSTTIWLESELRAYMEKVINQDLPKNTPVPKRSSRDREPKVVEAKGKTTKKPGADTEAKDHTAPKQTRRRSARKPSTRDGV